MSNIHHHPSHLLLKLYLQCLKISSECLFVTLKQYLHLDLLENPDIYQDELFHTHVDLYMRNVRNCGAMISLPDRLRSLQKYFTVIHQLQDL